MKNKTWVGLAFASPWIIGFLAFGLYPTVMSLYYSFTQFNILQPPQWIGLQNYQAMVRDPLFWQSVYNTLYITVLGVPLSIVLGLAAALLLNQKVRGVGVFRTLMYLPSIVPPVAVAIVWMFILNPDYGLLNAILSWFHLPQPGWLASPSFSKPALLFMALWQSGQVIVVLLAGLQDVPKSLYEAVRIDGAGPWKTFTTITLPMLSPVIFYNVVTGIVNFLQFFTQAFVATARDLGSPAHSTLFYTVYMYQNAFQYLKMGYASAMAWGLLLITLVLTWLVFRVGNRAVYYGGE
ncbi:MAG: sugar ABC transporter permease [Alicyclobacillus sp.]|nr:sugar ABC transporter permease [Alicyclobacillus sp.]